MRHRQEIDDGVGAMVAGEPRDDASIRAVGGDVQAGRGIGRASPRDTDRLVPEFSDPSQQMRADEARRAQHHDTHRRPSRQSASRACGRGWRMQA
jgi:hypothetical protein